MYKRVSMAYRLPFMTGCHLKRPSYLEAVLHGGTLSDTAPHTAHPHNLLWNNMDQIGLIFAPHLQPTVVSFSLGESAHPMDEVQVKSLGVLR